MEQKINKKQKETFGVQDKVLVTYQSKWYDMVNVPGIILSTNLSHGWPFHVCLQDKDGKPVNLGHNDDGGGPGSGQFMHCSESNLEMVEKYTPKRLKGAVRDTWRVGDRFIPKVGLCVDSDPVRADGANFVKVIAEMQCVSERQEELGIAVIMPLRGVDLLIDNVYNMAWVKEWIDPVE